jgi:hypothetical protein
MPAEPIAPELENLGDRAFSFYPPILNVEHNEWKLLRATWSEMLVHNTKSGDEIWVPRRFVGEISRIDEPVMIVGLKKELEFKAGQVVQHERRVLSMPSTPQRIPRTEQGAVVAPKGHSSSTKSESRLVVVILGMLVFGIAATYLLVSYFRSDHIEYKAIEQQDLGFNAQSDYFDVVNKLGKPAADRWKSDSGERQLRALDYPAQGLTIILMGVDRNKEHYIGAMNKDWRPVHYIRHAGGGDTRALLDHLPKF